MSYKEDTKKFKDMANFRVKCKCGHTTIMSRAERTACSWCGNWIYRNAQIEFHYKLKEKLIREKRNMERH